MYRVWLRPPAQRFLRKLRDKSLTARLVAAMRELASRPETHSLPPTKQAGPQMRLGSCWLLRSQPARKSASDRDVIRAFKRTRAAARAASKFGESATSFTYSTYRIWFSRFTTNIARLSMRSSLIKVP